MSHHTTPTLILSCLAGILATIALMIFVLNQQLANLNP